MSFRGGKEGLESFPRSGIGFKTLGTPSGCSAVANTTFLLPLDLALLSWETAAMWLFLSSTDGHNKEGEGKRLSNCRNVISLKQSGRKEKLVSFLPCEVVRQKSLDQIAENLALGS